MLPLRRPVRNQQGICSSRLHGTQKNWWNPCDPQSPHLVIHNLKTGLPYQIVAICGTTHHSGNDSDQLPPFTISIQHALASEFKSWNRLIKRTPAPRWHTNLGAVQQVTKKERSRQSGQWQDGCALRPIKKRFKYRIVVTWGCITNEPGLFELADHTGLEESLEAQHVAAISWPHPLRDMWETSHSSGAH